MMNQRALLQAGPAAAAAASEGVVPAHFYRSSLDCLFKVGGPCETLIATVSKESRDLSGKLPAEFFCQSQPKILV